LSNTLEQELARGLFCLTFIGLMGPLLQTGALK
jgi:hypothetical protein